MRCNCGIETNHLKAYFHKESGLRVTACETCVKEKELDNEKLFYSKPINQLTEQDNKTPEPNGKN